MAKSKRQQQRASQQTAARPTTATAQPRRTGGPGPQRQSITAAAQQAQRRKEMMKWLGTGLLLVVFAVVAVIAIQQSRDSGGSGSNTDVATVVAAQPIPEGVQQNGNVLGDPNAPVTLVEYGDYQCPSCGLAYPVVEHLRQHFGGNLRFVFRHFPLATVHPLAEPAAETAEFTALHDKFWSMHDGLFLNQRQLGMPLLFALTGALDLPQAELRDALTSGACAGKVRDDFRGGVRSGVNGTPTFFVNRLRYDAPWDFPNLARAINEVLVEARGGIMSS